MEADEDRCPAGRERVVDELGGLDRDPRLELARVDGGRAGDLEVVAGGVSIGQPDEAFEGPGIRGGRTGERRAGALGGEPADDASQVAAGLVGAGGRGPIPELAGDLGEGDEGALRQPTGDPRSPDERSTEDPAADASGRSG